MEDTPLSPVLLRFPLVDRATGLVTRPWQQWFTASWYRQGGANAPPNDALGGELGVLETALEETQAALAATQAALEATQAQLAATQAALETTQAELEATQAALDATQTELDATQAALDATQSALDGTQAELDATQAELAATQAELEATQAELEATQAAMSALLPDGTAQAVARYQADGSGVEASTGVVIDDTGRLGVGTTTPQVVLDAVGEIRSHLAMRIIRDGGSAVYNFSTYQDGVAFGNALLGQRYAGTEALPAAVTTDMLLLRVQARGYNGTASVDGGLIDLTAEQAFSAGRGTRLTIATGTLGSSAAPVERLRIDSQGRIGLCNTGAPTAPLDVNGNTIRLRTARTPASATAAGNQGDFAWDSSYLFICTATNTWRRVAHATW